MSAIDNFRAGRRQVADLRELFELENMDEVTPGYVYEDGEFFVIVEPGGQFFCLLEGDFLRSMNLEEVEEWLFARLANG